MENKKEVGSSSSSSFTTELFGAKDSIAPSSSSLGVFASIFSPPSMVATRNSYASSELTNYSQNQPPANQAWSTKQATPDNISKNDQSVSSCETKKERRSVFQEITEPSCPLSSSLYYGGQEDMYIRSSSTHQTSSTSCHNASFKFKKDDGGEDDPNGNASRGNWWQGSLYY